MRLISQDGCKDIPYASTMLTVAESYRGGYNINAHIMDEQPICMGLYSTEENALKVMGMVQETYRKHSASQVYWNGVAGSFTFADDIGTMEKISDYLSKELRDCACFKFPQDSEV